MQLFFFPKNAEHQKNRGKLQHIPWTYPRPLHHLFIWFGNVWKSFYTIIFVFWGMLQGSVGIREKTVWSLRSQQNPPTSSNRRFVASAIPRSQLHDMFFVCDALKWPTKCLHSNNQLPGILIESRLEVRSLHSVYNIWWVFPKIGGPPKMDDLQRKSLFFNEWFGGNILTTISGGTPIIYI